MRGFALGSACALVLAALPAQAITTPGLSLTFQPGGNSLITTSLIFENFNGPVSGTSIGTNARVQSGNNNLGARPFVASGPVISTGNFATVFRANNVNGLYTLRFSDYASVFPNGRAQVFSFALGSLDAHNSVTLNFTNSASETFNGIALTNFAPTGSQNSPQNNGRVTFNLASGPTLRNAITSVDFRSSGVAFEFDDLAGAAPEPGTWAMLLIGFGLAGHGLRRGRKTVAA